MTINPLRIHCRNQVSEAPGAVVYWMSRDQRVADNWALLHAQNLALERRLPLAVVFTLTDSFLGATLRHFGFMLRGLAGVAERLQELGIAFVLLRGNPPDEMCRFIQQHKVGALVTDFDPLRIKRSWHDQVAGSVPIPCIEVDAHNVVPCRIASTRQEYGAYTIRPKIQRLLPDFLDAFPPVSQHPFPWPAPVNDFDGAATLSGMAVDRSVAEIGWLTPGERGGRAQLDDFITNGLAFYETERNDPCRHGQSGLSPW